VTSLLFCSTFIRTVIKDNVYCTGTGPIGTGPIGTGPIGTGPIGTGPIGTGPTQRKQIKE